jgi:hypothetical protein
LIDLRNIFVPPPGCPFYNGYKLTFSESYLTVGRAAMFYESYWNTGNANVQNK